MQANTDQDGLFTLQNHLPFAEAEAEAAQQQDFSFYPGRGRKHTTNRYSAFGWWPPAVLERSYKRGMNIVDENYE